MLCRKCGKELPEGASVCDACGTKNESAQTERRRSGPKVDIYAVFAVVKKVLLLFREALNELWTTLLRGLYKAFSGVSPETNPTVHEVFAEGKAWVAQLSKARRRILFTCSALAVVLLVSGAWFTVRTVETGSSGGGGGGIWVSHREPYQPEFSKLDCLTCGGDGDCNTCGGYGEVDRYAGAGDTVRSKCSSCYGSGNCRTCGGSGKR